MKISLPSDLEEFVQARVRAGQYRDIDEAVVHALYLLKGQDAFRAYRLGELRKAVDQGIRQADKGEVVGGEQFFRGLKRRNSRRRRKTA